MAQLWRPFEAEVQSGIEENAGLQISGKPEKKSRCSVSKKEEGIILQAYKSCTGGWDEILKCVQEKVNVIKSGDYLKQAKTKEYYQNASKKAAMKRIQRVLNKSLKRAEDEGTSTFTLSEASNSMADSIKKAKTRYSEKLKPEEWKQKKLDLMIDSSSDDGSAPPSNKSKTMGPEEEEEEDTQNESKPVSVSKKRKRNRKQDAAQEAHTKMCERAMGMMDKISNLLEKYDSDSN